VAYYNVVPTCGSACTLVAQLVTQLSNDALSSSAEVPLFPHTHTQILHLTHTYSLKHTLSAECSLYLSFSLSLSLPLSRALSFPHSLSFSHFLKSIGLFCKRALQKRPLHTLLHSRTYARTSEVFVCFNHPLTLSSPHTHIFSDDSLFHFFEISISFK